MALAILFDIDGTLLLAQQAAKVAINKVFLERFSVERAFGQTPTHGRTDPVIIKEIFENSLGRNPTAEELREVQQQYVAELGTSLQNNTEFTLLPGVTPLLERLSANPKVILGLETGNIESAAMLKLSRGGLLQFFSFGGFGSDDPKRANIIRRSIERGTKVAEKKGLTIDNVVVIGDALQDIRAAKDVGVRVVGVATGACTEKELNEAGADQVLGSFENLEETEQVILDCGLA